MVWIKFGGEYSADVYVPGQRDFARGFSRSELGAGALSPPFGRGDVDGHLDPGIVRSSLNW